MPSAKKEKEDEAAGEAVPEDEMGLFCCTFFLLDVDRVHVC